MKNGLLAFAAAAAVSVAAISAGSVAFAADGPGVYINESGCTVPDAANPPVFHHIYTPGLGGDAVVQSVITPNGNVKTTCSGTLVHSDSDNGPVTLPDTGAKVWTSDDFKCLVHSQLADSAFAVVTSAGEASLTCEMKGDYSF